MTVFRDASEEEQVRCVDEVVMKLEGLAKLCGLTGISICGCGCCRVETCDTQPVAYVYLWTRYRVIESRNHSSNAEVMHDLTL